MYFYEVDNDNSIIPELGRRGVRDIANNLGNRINSSFLAALEIESRPHAW
jgi:hypothetical protein